MFHTDDNQAVGEFPIDLIGDLGESDAVRIVGRKSGPRRA